MSSSARLLLCCFWLATLAGGADVPAAYTNTCSKCHGVDGKGNPAAGAMKAAVPDLHSKAVQELSDEEMYQTIARGDRHKAYAHAFLYRGMTEKEIRELVKYIRTFDTAGK